MQNLENICIDVPRAENCILINTNDWVSSSAIQICRMSGRNKPTGIIKVLGVNTTSDYFKGIVNKGDLVLLSSMISDISKYRNFSLNEDGYFYSPIMQVLGVFRNNEISFETLDMCLDKILIKKITPKYDEFLITPNDNTIVGEVIKTGTCRFDKEWNKQELRVKVGDKVLIKDNVSTEISLSNETYLATEESSVVCIFKNSFNLDEATFINESVLLESYTNKEFTSNLLEIPDLNYDDLDFTDIQNRDLFKVLYHDKTLSYLNDNDIILTDRNLTNYVYFNAVRYFIINGMQNIEAKIG